jgi:diguanylate cyclase (GGDEF)-like protein/PAS domain S-box-containing protein
MMEFQFPAINYLYLIAFVMAACLAVFSAMVARHFGARLWVAVMISFAIWTLGETIANMGTTLAWQLGFQRMVYLGVVCAVTSWLLFALHYAGQERWLTAGVLVILLVVPVFSLFMVMTLEWHTLLYRSAELVERNGYKVLQVEYGAGFWVQTIASSYLYTLVGSILLLATSMRRPRIYRSQSILVGIAALMPVIPNIFYVAGYDLAGGFDPTSLFFVLSAILVTVANQQYQFLSLTPVARDLVFDSVNIAVVVVNANNQISDVNPAFNKITDNSQLSILGRPLHEVFTENFDGCEEGRVNTHWQGRLTSKQSGHLFDVTSMPVMGYRKEQIGFLILLNDVTQVQKALDEISRLASTDVLTELPNRRAMQSWAEESWHEYAHKDSTQDERPSDLEAAEQSNDSLLVVADIDNFKILNDRFGHAAGDKVLTEMAALIRANIRPSDKLARWGGEEFCLVLTRTDPQTGAAAIKRLRQRIENHRFDIGEGPMQITMTFGVVVMQPGEPMENAIKRADAAMYEGKAQGRNRVVAAF